MVIQRKLFLFYSEQKSDGLSTSLNLQFLCELSHYILFIIITQMQRDIFFPWINCATRARGDVILFLWIMNLIIKRVVLFKLCGERASVRAFYLHSPGCKSSSACERVHTQRATTGVLCAQLKKKRQRESGAPFPPQHWLQMCTARTKAAHWILFSRHSD